MKPVLTNTTGGDDVDEFEILLKAEQISVERFVRFKINSKADVDDVIQEIFFSAYQKFPQLKNKSSFKAWIISIARNKCNDYFRKKAIQHEIPIEELAENQISDSRYGVSITSTVRETLSLLGDKDKQILYLCFWKEMPQAEIAKQLNIWKEMPEFLPSYKIEESTKEPFSVKWEELMGWFLVPKLGEKISWGMYDIPSCKCSHIYDMEVIGKAKVHGIEGVELIARETSYSNKNDVIDRTFVAQLTDTHCRYLATLRNDGDIRNYITFLDGDEFLLN